MRCTVTISSSRDTMGRSWQRAFCTASAPQPGGEGAALANLELVEREPRAQLAERTCHCRHHAPCLLSALQVRALHHQDAAFAVRLEVAARDDLLVEQKGKYVV